MMLLEVTSHKRWLHGGSRSAAVSLILARLILVGLLLAAIQIVSSVYFWSVLVMSLIQSFVWCR